MQVYVLVSMCRDQRKMPGDLMCHSLACSLLEPGAKLASSKPRGSSLSVPAQRPGVAGTYFVFVFKWVLRSELMSSCLRSNPLLSLQPWLPWFCNEALTAAFCEICLTPWLSRLDEQCHQQHRALSGPKTILFSLLGVLTIYSQQ